MSERIGSSPRAPGAPSAAPAAAGSNASTAIGTGTEPGQPGPRRIGLELQGAASALGRAPALPASAAVAVDNTTRRDAARGLKDAVSDIGEAGR